MAHSKTYGHYYLTGLKRHLKLSTAPLYCNWSGRLRYFSLSEEEDTVIWVHLRLHGWRSWGIWRSTVEMCTRLKKGKFQKIWCWLDTGSCRVPEFDGMFITDWNIIHMLSTALARKLRPSCYGAWFRQMGGLMESYGSSYCYTESNCQADKILLRDFLESYPRSSSEKGLPE